MRLGKNGLAMHRKGFGVKVDTTRERKSRWRALGEKRKKGLLVREKGLPCIRRFLKKRQSGKKL